MTTEFTQGYPDWGRMVAANPEPFVNETGVNHDDGDTLGRFPIAGWRSLFHRVQMVGTDVLVRFTMHSDAVGGPEIFREHRWSLDNRSAHGWVPLVGNFLEIRLFQNPVIGPASTNLQLVPVAYPMDRAFTTFDEFLLEESGTIAATSTSTFSAIDTYIGPVVFHFTHDMADFVVRLQYFDVNGTLRTLALWSDTRAAIPGGPMFFYMPNGQARVQITNNDAATRNFTLSLTPQKPGLGSA